MVFGNAREPACLLPFFNVPFVCAGLPPFRVLRFAGSGAGVGVGVGASLFTLADFLIPSPVIIVVGPLASKDFQGGESARDADRRGGGSSSSLRFLDGR